MPPEYLTDPEGGCQIGVLRPDWPAPANVNAVTTLRQGGVSRPPYQGLNLAAHVGDDPEAVRCNRAALHKALQLPDAPAWLTQVHGSRVIELGVDALPEAPDATREADGAWSGRRGCVCVVLTADCLPVLFCDRRGTRVAAVHAGWRGLATGILDVAIRALAVPAADVLVWLGPAIGPQAFEVGGEVRDVFVRRDETASRAFRRSPASRQGDERYLADIYELARIDLRRCGVHAIYGAHWCTFEQRDLFYSYRRDGRCGRMASLVWLS